MGQAHIERLLILGGGAEPDVRPAVGQHVDDVLRPLGEQLPVERGRLADEGPEILTGAGGRLEVEDVSEARAEDAMPAPLKCPEEGIEPPSEGDVSAQAGAYFAPFFADCFAAFCSGGTTEPATAPSPRYRLGCPCVCRAATQQAWKVSGAAN